MSWPKKLFLCAVLFLWTNFVWTDVIVQLNINRPINDVSDKFISFTIRPEDLYKALDSSNRKTITRMASMLSHSHIKFVGDYHFAAKNAGIRLRNPTKIVWKGFNKWTKAINWSMIIPVPYKPDNWDPMETLKILNTSQMVDIDEAIWQLGTDFGTSRAADYVSELKTFNVMVDSFRQNFMNWQTMGADISAGSSPEETRRYVEMSRDLNVAYGWIQSDDMFSSNSLGSGLDNLDPALKVLFRSKVPIWLTLPEKKSLPLLMDDEIIEGLSWAQTMGEAANVGFATIFKALTLDDMVKPKYGFFVTALFKKIMGSRVYPARPLGLFGQKNKLYTHCANMMSGGLAFMVVNKEDQPLQLAVRSMDKLQDTEVWHYALTMQNGQVLLNNKHLFMNSSLMPEVQSKDSHSMLQLKTPGLSVSFWVLPNANLEHCHFTEVETTMMSPDDDNQKLKRYSSSDRLLKELIKESTKPSFSPFAGLTRRQRRSLDDDRFRRFILEGAKAEVKPLTTLAGNLIQSPLKREVFSPERKAAAIEWLSNIFKEPIIWELPSLNRNARQSDSFQGPFFMTRDGKKAAFTKKITEIKKPEKKVKKFQLEDQEFDEETFFKNVGQQPEPDYTRFPEGDVFLSNIASVDGDELEEELNMETKRANKPRTQKKEIINEMKPLRLLPTEFFETLQPKPIQPLYAKDYIGSLLYSDPFGMTYGKNLNFRQDRITKEIMEPESHKDMDVEEDKHDGDGDDDEDDNNNLVKTQIELSQKALSHKPATKDNEKSIGKREEEQEEDLLDADEENISENRKTHYNSFLASDDLNFYVDATKTEKNYEKSIQPADNSNNSKHDEIPWWDLSSKRMKRSLDSVLSGNTWRNMISKEAEHVAAANALSPARLHNFEYKVDEVVRSANNNKNEDDEDVATIGKRIVKTVKEQATKLVDLFSHHANIWYNTFSKQLDNAMEETTTKGNLIQ